MRLPARASVGQVFSAQLADGRYAACQVIGAHGDEVEIIGLDWLGERPPTLDELAAVRPLRIHHHAHKPHIARLNVPEAPPFWFELVGQREPIARFPGRSNAWSGWGAAVNHALSQWRWDHEAPAEKKEAYRQAHGDEEVRLVFAGQEHVLPARTWRLWLGPSKGTPRFALQVDPDAALDWAQLDQLGALAEVVYTGRDPGFAEFLRTRWLTRATWRGHRQSAIDLRGAALRELTIDAGDAPLDLAVDKLMELTVHGTAAQLRLDNPAEGRGLRLALVGAALPAAPIAGCSELHWLGMRGLEAADCGRLVGYEHLQSVSLCGAPGALRELGALAALPELRRIALRDFYDAELAALPNAASWPQLDTFEWTGLGEAQHAQLEQHFAGLRVLAMARVRQAEGAEA